MVAKRRASSNNGQGGAPSAEETLTSKKVKSELVKQEGSALDGAVEDPLSDASRTCNSVSTTYSGGLWPGSKRVKNGPVVRDGMAYVPLGQDKQDTTPDVDYVAISLGKHMSWFAQAVRKMQNMGELFPCYSHGFSRRLARVHAQRPKISYAYDVSACGGIAMLRLFKIIKYESAGVWVDSGGYACLAIHALFEDGEKDMRLLYSCNFRESAYDVDGPAQWTYT